MLTNYCLMLYFYVRISYEVFESDNNVSFGSNYDYTWGFKLTAEIVAKFFEDFQYKGLPFKQNALTESLDTREKLTGQEENAQSDLSTHLDEIPSILQLKAEIESLRKQVTILEKKFDHSNTHCFLDIKKVSNLQPLMVSMSLTWPTFEISESGEMIIPSGKEFLLTCPQNFLNYPNKKYIIATCKGGTNILVNQVEHHYLDLQCSKKVVHILKKTGIKCLPGNTEKYKILFNIFNDVYIELFEICMEKGNNDPIYAKFTMTNSFADVDFSTPWQDSNQFSLNFPQAYDCTAQKAYISHVLNRPFHENDQCCFALIQLVSYRNVFPGVAQRAAFTYVNTGALWNTCNAENWHDVERRVRKLAKSLPNSLLVWTGVKFHDKNEIAFGNVWNHPPFYLWKVVQDPGTKSSLAIIYVNVPDVTSTVASSLYKLCTDICNQTEWMRGSDWADDTRGYTYCCTIEEFQKAFDFQVFEPNHDSILIGVPR